jgi:hypothetical protein
MSYVRNPNVEVLGIDKSFEVVKKALDSSKKVYVSRFGDGEYNGIVGAGSQHHDYNPELAKELDHCIHVDDPNFLIGVGCNFPVEDGMFPGIFYPPPRNNDFTLYLEKEFKGKSFFNAVFFSYLSVYRQDEFIKFLDKYIRPKSKVYIGPLEKEIVEKCLGEIKYFIKVPRKNAYSTINDWYPQLKEYCKEVEVVLPFTGVCTEALHSRMWKDNLEVQSIDIGSFIDGIFFPSNRKWVRLKAHVMNNLLLPEYRDNSIGEKLKYHWGEFKFNTRLMRKKLFGTLYINK